MSSSGIGVPFRKNISRTETLHERVPKVFSKRALAEESAETVFCRFLAGDTGAFGRLFELYNARLFRYCYKLVRDRAAAEDLTEDMWLKLIENRSKLSEKENVLAFLYRVLHNHTLNYLTGKGAGKGSFPEVGSSGERAAEVAARESRSEIEEIILECIEHLPPASKELLVLHYYSGFSFKEIAEAWQIEPQAIWTRATRARNQLKTLVESRLK